MRQSRVNLIAYVVGPAQGIRVKGQGLSIAGAPDLIVGAPAANRNPNLYTRRFRAQEPEQHVLLSIYLSIYIYI